MLFAKNFNLKTFPIRNQLWKNAGANNKTTETISMESENFDWFSAFLFAVDLLNVKMHNFSSEFYMKSSHTRGLMLLSNIEKAAKLPKK